jgi:hypothetical protein
VQEEEDSDGDMEPGDYEQSTFIMDDKGTLWYSSLDETVAKANKKISDIISDHKKGKKK